MSLSIQDDIARRSKVKSRHLGLSRTGMQCGYMYHIYMCVCVCACMCVCVYCICAYVYVCVECIWALRNRGHDDQPWDFRLSPLLWIIWPTCAGSAALIC